MTKRPDPRDPRHQQTPGPKQTIVKVQTASHSCKEQPDVMIYAKGHAGQWHGPSLPVYKLMGGPLRKKYFFATRVGTLWRLDGLAPDQDW